MSRRTESTADALRLPPQQPRALFQQPPRSSVDLPDIPAIQRAVQDANTWVSPLRTEMARVLVGQHALVDRLIVALLTGGHVLLEGLPGLAKTLALKTLAQVISTGFRRIQFTPDMLPADIVGTLIHLPLTPPSS